MAQRILCLTPVRIRPGMTLARPAVRPDGQILLPAGTVLSEEHLQHLMSRGVEYLSVSSDDTRDEAAIAAEVAATGERVDYIFRGSGSSDARDELREAIRTYRLARAA